ncbi:LON peptidase substrate-binding domain-containing protein, partial [Clostridium perfringens]|uniref:LON peptidase substrate-binding domain-containing protein n=1 Tax=Clostridium perfringens TaxID=1502 RepID=UPI002AC552A6
MSEQLITLPLIPLRGISIFPNMIIHFDVGREKSKAAIEAAIENQTDIFLATQKDYELEEPSIGDIYNIGTICKIKQIIKLPNDIIRVLVEGTDRGEIKGLDTEQQYLQVCVARIEEPSNDEYEDIAAYIKTLKKSYNNYI